MTALRYSAGGYDLHGLAEKSPMEYEGEIYGFNTIDAMYSKVAFRFPPNSVTAPTITAAIKATRSPYSTALAPLSSLKKASSLLIEFLLLSRRVY